MYNKKKIIIIAALVLVAAAAAALISSSVYCYEGEAKICLDAGHGGDDVGAVNGDRYEKDDNLRLTLAVGEILRENGYRVIYTRKKDETVELESRAEFANRKKATHFVSIHRNSADSAASGVEIWIENTATIYEENFAQGILDKINEIGLGKDRGVRRGYQGNSSGNYLVNSATDMPSCLVEMGFITTPEDNELFDENFEKYALAIAEGIMENCKQ